MQSLIGLFQIGQNGIVHEYIVNKLCMKNQSPLDCYPTNDQQFMHSLIVQFQIGQNGTVHETIYKRSTTIRLLSYYCITCRKMTKKKRKESLQSFIKNQMVNNSCTVMLIVYSCTVSSDCFK